MCNLELQNLHKLNFNISHDLIHEIQFFISNQSKVKVKRQRKGWMLDTHLLNDERGPKVRPAMESEAPGLPLAPGQLDVHRLARSAHTD